MADGSWGFRNPILIDLRAETAKEAIEVRGILEGSGMRLVAVTHRGCRGSVDGEVERIEDAIRHHGHRVDAPSRDDHTSSVAQRLTVELREVVVVRIHQVAEHLE